MAVAAAPCLTLPAGSGTGLRAATVRSALMALGAGYFLSYVFRNLNGIVASDIMRDLGVGADVLGQLTSVYFLAFAAAQVPVGVLLDRHGPRRVQGWLLLCAAAGAALCALDGGVATLLAGRALIGLGTAGCLVAGLKAAAAWVPPGQVAAVNAALVTCGGLGALAATWPVELGLRLVDWRGVYAVLAALACVAALAIRFAVPDLGASNLDVPNPSRTAGAGQGDMRLRDIVRDPLFLRFAPLSAACFGTVLAMQGLWAGPWLADVDRLTRPEVADELAWMAAVLVVAAPCWGALTVWLRRVGLLQAAAVATMVLMAAEGLIVARTGLPPLLPWCLLTLFGGMSVLSFSVFAGHFPAGSIGRANGALNVLHVGCSFVVQLGVGQVVALWPAVGGHYPAEAYQAAMLLPLALQACALAWFAWPRRSVSPA